MKKNFRKGLSLFLAVIMTMSCWVFAPVTASAVNAGLYDVRWEVFDSDDGCSGGGTCKVDNIWFNNNNGKGSEGTTGSYTLSSSERDHLKNGGDPVNVYWRNVGFPNRIKVSWDIGISYKPDWDFRLYVSVAGANNWFVVIPQTVMIHDDSIWHTKKGDKTVNVDASKFPYANSVERVGSNPANIAVPKSGTASATAKFRAKDQYGVVLATNVTGSSQSCSVTTSDSIKTGITCSQTNDASDGVSFTAAVTNDAKMQSGNSKTVYFNPSFTFNNRTATLNNGAQFNLEDCKYTYTYNGNGGTISPASCERYYYMQADSFPTSGTRTGYEFIGMYENAKSDYGFTKPAAGSSAGWENNLKLTTIVENDKTWYAAWWAKSYDVQFVTADGQPIETLQAKYDKHAVGEYLSKARPADPEWKPGAGMGDGAGERVFEGWYVKTAEDANGNLLLDMTGKKLEEYVIQGKTTFEPRYTIIKKSYTVNFLDENGSELWSSKDLHYADQPTLIPQTEKAADDTYTYKFSGWAVKGDKNSHIVENGVDVETNKPVALTDDFTVRCDRTYVPVFEREYIDYTVKFEGYSTDGTKELTSTAYENLHWGDEVTVPTAVDYIDGEGGRFIFKGWSKTADEKTSDVSTACDGNVTYTAVYERTDAVYTIIFKDHNGDVISTQTVKHGEVVEEIKPTQTYREGDFEYTFKGWKPEVSPVAKADVTYEPVYEAVQLLTVTYHFDSGDTEPVQYAPNEAISHNKVEGSTDKPGDEYAEEYTFAYWKDADGDKVEDGTKVTANMDLYPEYTCTPTEYTVNFVYKGEEHKGTYHFGDSLNVPSKEDANHSDNKFDYEFIDWEPKLPDPAACYGDVTYTAVYKNKYKYYTTTWYNEDGSKFGENKQIWDAVIIPPPTTPTTDKTSDENHKWVFDGWYYKNAPDKRFELGTKIAQDNYEFIANFKEVANPRIVNFYDNDGTTLLATMEIPYDTVIEDIEFKPFPKKKDQENHLVFDKWADKDTDIDMSEFSIKNEVTNLKAFYKDAPHTESDIVTDAPATFFAEGSGHYICPDCGEEVHVTLDKPKDEKAPNIKIYVGNNTYTENGDLNAAAAPVAPTSRFIINTVDKADEDQRGCGVAKIEYSVQSGEADPETIENWVPRFNYDEADESIRDLISFEANTTNLLSDLGLENEQEFVIYVKVTDRLGNIAYINTGKFVYDNVAPALTVTSDHEFVSGKHCTDATIRFTYEDGMTVTLDGTTLLSGEFTVNTAGTHQVVAIDAAGNKTVVSFEIMGGHSLEEYRFEATCTENGYSVQKCTRCGYATEKETIEHKGHKYGEAVTTKATCTKPGAKTETCSVCGYVHTIETYPALDHQFGKWIVDTEATCGREGKQHRECSVCGAVEKKVIPVDPNQHAWQRPVTVKPTCTTGGYTVETCKYCGVQRKTNETPAHGHGGTIWVTTKPATCTEAGERTAHCDICGAPVGSGETAPIPALGHDYRYQGQETHGGKLCAHYKCTRIGCNAEKWDEIPVVETYTVTFLNEDGTKIKDVTKQAGETITFSDVQEPVKSEADGHKYKFKAWIDADKNEYTFPLTVSANLTLTALFEERPITYAITFKSDDNTVCGKTYAKYGDNIFELAKKYQPADYQTATASFKFTGWDPEITEGMTVKGNEVFTAQFEETPRTFTVIFAVDADNVLEVHKNVKAGATVTFEGDPSKIPQKPCDGSFHYTFGGWSEDTTNVTSDMFVTPVYEKAAHTFITTSTEADCTHGGGTSHKCTGCDYHYEVSTGAPLGHEMVVDKVVEPTHDAPGYIDSHCTRPGCTYHEHKELAQKEFVVVTFYLTDSKGIPVGGATVSAYKNGSYIISGATDQNGKLTLAFPEAGDYMLVIEGKNFATVTGEVTVNADGTIDMSRLPQIVISTCTCTCHKDGVWPSIFRFFHKIIRALTGKYQCCKCPDERYN